MHKKAIEILSENDLNNWLFYFQKYLLTMKILTKFNYLSDRDFDIQENKYNQIF
jgi:hypothetical protein